MTMNTATAPTPQRTTEPTARRPAAADPFADAPIISCYTRAQAIADEVLVDVTKTAREAGWRFPVAVTKAVHAECVAWTDDDSKKRPNTCQDEGGRLWDVVWMAAFGAKQHRGASRFLYTLRVVPRPRYGRRMNRELACSIGPGDDGEPVVTIMLPDED